MTVYTPAQAAAHLGVKPSTLRRYVLLYEQTFGPLPRDDQDARIYDETAMERLNAAKALYEERRAPSYETALRSLMGGAETLERHSDDKGALVMLLRELNSRLARMEEKLERLEARELPEPKRPWWRIWRRE